MDVRGAIIANFGIADTISFGYIDDLKPEELFFRPTPKCNHLAWQLGHLIVNERYFVDKIAPGKIEALPEAFIEAHGKKNCGCDDPALFATKEEYIRLAKQVRAGTLRVINSLTTGDLDRPMTQGVPPFLRTVGEVLLFLPAHWLMHAGQWSTFRRVMGKPPLF